MISNEHKKHSNIARPSLGNFGRNEFAILGTTCGNIQALAGAVIKSLSAKYKCAYIDAEHNDKNDALQSQDAFVKFTDKISFRELHYKNELDKFQYHQVFNETDLVLVNGNHNEAAAQIVVIDKVKEGSLIKRIKQLNNVQMILLNDNVDGIFDFVKEAIPNWQSLPILSLHETDNIIAFFQNRLMQNTPVLNGVVLAGGKSVRMGFDKTLIEWHGKEQRDYMADILSTFCKDVFISCRDDQQQQVAGYKTITDSFTGLGPYGAILSAFRENPDVAWLVVASDLPLMDKATLQYLVDHRDIAAVATTFESPFDGFPEPLITIWEPKAYSILLSFLAQGYSCPRKALRNNNVRSIKAQHPEKLMNVNTQEELAKAKELLQRKISLL